MSLHLQRVKRPLPLHETTKEPWDLYCGQGILKRQQRMEELLGFFGSRV